MAGRKRLSVKIPVSLIASALSAVMVIGSIGQIAETAEAVDAGAFYEDRLTGEGAGRSGAAVIGGSYAFYGKNPGVRDIAVYIDGIRYDGDAFLLKDTTYVGIRRFTEMLAGAKVSWNAASKTASAVTSDVTLTAKAGAEYICANGRYLWANTGVIIYNDTMYVPIRPLCTAYGASLVWNGAAGSVHIKRGSGTITPGDKFYREDEVYWLSKIIHAESRGEPLTGKIAVGNVVLNRTRSPEYPSTIYGVIFDRKYGIQFSPVLDGSIKLTPDEQSIIAAKLCLEGYTVSDKIIFFINSSIAASSWVEDTRYFQVRIGKHDFYS